MPPPSQNSPSETKKIRVHSPFLHARLPQMFPLVNYVYRTFRQSPSHQPPLSTSGTATSLTLTSLLPVSSMTQTKKTLHPPYQQFHVVVPPFAHHLAESRQPSPSPTTPIPTKHSSLPLPEYETTSTVATHMSGRSKRSFKSLVPSDTKGRPAKMAKLQCSSRDYTKFDDWNLDLSCLSLRHQHPLCHETTVRG